MAASDDLFEQLSALHTAQRHPPVHLWQPEHTGTIDIRIDSDGGWHHEGAPILRKTLVRLFSTVLRRDEDGYWLVTPVEKLKIVVDDVPFIAVDAEVRAGEKRAGNETELLFTTNVGDYVIADREHPLWVAGTTSKPCPYLHVRSGLNARISRALYYRLADLCVADDDGYWLTSRGARFQLG